MTIDERNRLTNLPAVQSKLNLIPEYENRRKLGLFVGRRLEKGISFVKILDLAD